MQTPQIVQTTRTQPLAKLVRVFSFFIRQIVYDGLNETISCGLNYL